MNSENKRLTFDIDLIEQAEIQAEKERQEALRVYPDIQAAIVWLDRARLASREAREKIGPQIKEAQKFLQDNLFHQAPAVRRAVWRAVLGFELTRTINTRAEVETLLASLVRRGFLQEIPDGYLWLYGKAYQIHPNSLFGDPEKTEVRNLFGNLLSKVKEGFLARSTITIEELFSGSRGECAIEVPPGKVEQNGKEVWLGGGVLYLRSDGEYITPEDAMGSIEGGIQEAEKLGVRLRIDSLKSNQPPFVPRLDHVKGAKLRLLWWLLKRARRLDEEKKGFPKKATISPEEFFLKKGLGVCLATFPGVWEVKEEGKVISRIHSMFFLVERREEGTKRIHIVEVPTHLGDFFAQCMGEHEEGDRYEGCPQPLRAVLQAISGHVYREARAARRVGQIANT